MFVGLIVLIMGIGVVFIVVFKELDECLDNIIIVIGVIGS